MARCSEREPNIGTEEDKMADGKVDIGGWLTETWELYKANFGLMLVATLVAMPAPAPHQRQRGCGDRPGR